MEATFTVPLTILSFLPIKAYTIKPWFQADLIWCDRTFKEHQEVISPLCVQWKAEIGRKEGHRQVILVWVY